MDRELLASRFVRVTDPHNSCFVWQMPDAWWSRLYEYEWARQFAQPDAVVLDAACGIEHPLKFYLLDHCRKCYACDLDDRIADGQLMARMSRELYGLDADGFPQRYLDEIDYRVASLTNLPYENDLFDRVFCISTLEHLPDRLNKWPALGMVESVLPLKQDIRDSLLEFKRVLRSGGLIVLTFDFPRVNLEYLRRLVDQLGLQFAGDVDFNLPPDAHHSAEHDLYCFRTVLTDREHPFGQA